MISNIKFHANRLIMLYTNYNFSNNNKNILVCNFDLDNNIYRNKIINNNVSGAGIGVFNSTRCFPRPITDWIVLECLRDLYFY